MTLGAREPGGSSNGGHHHYSIRRIISILHLTTINSALCSFALKKKNYSLMLFSVPLLGKVILHFLVFLDNLASPFMKSSHRYFS